MTTRHSNKILHDHIQQILDISYSNQRKGGGQQGRETDQVPKDENEG